jgi:hypothetical protein
MRGYGSKQCTEPSGSNILIELKRNRFQKLFSDAFHDVKDKYEDLE